MENSTKKLPPLIEKCKNDFLARRVVSDLDIALAAMEVLDEYRWVPEPTPPERVKKYMVSSPDLKKKMRDNPDSYTDYWRNPETMQYYDQRVLIRNKNDRNKSWLNWMKKTLGDEHEVAISLKLHQFTDRYHEDIAQPKWGE